MEKVEGWRNFVAFMEEGEKSRKWWKNGEEDEDGVERKWRRERKVKVESYVKMRWVVRFMQVGVGLVRVIRS